MAEERKRGLLARATDAVKNDLQASRDASSSVADERAAAVAAQQHAAAEDRERRIAAGDAYEYKVVSVRESLIGDKINTDDLEGLLNRYAQEFWRVKTITSASVAGRVGPGGVSGLVLVFERRVTT